MKDYTFQLLLVTMNNSDYSNISKQNISSDAVIANQTSFHSLAVKNIDQNNIRIITTDTKGVGRNRNIALLYATADICLLADDDIEYIDGYKDEIIRAFNEISDADAIIFNVQETQDRGRRKNQKISRVRIWNSLNYGAVRCAFRRKSVQKANIWFSVLFGGGSIFGSGEDSIFITDMLKHKLKIYTYPVTIANIADSKSSWFSGYNEKYFTDKGALLNAIFPKFTRLICFFYALKSKKLTNQYSAFEIYKFLLNGRKLFKEAT